MTADIYNLILEHAPNSTYPSAGDLHEALWVALLRRSDPRVHNVRVTRGDGGLDGVAFQDPVLGEARVYQAKFYEHLNDKKCTHRAAIADAFVRAHNHPFVCTSWVLVLPRMLSHTDLGWLTGTMKKDAVGLASSMKSIRSDIVTRIDACAIEYLDGTDLEDLLYANLDIAAKYLPNCHLALMKQLEDERTARAKEHAEVSQLLRVMNDETIRSHQADARRAKAALVILNQGWANLLGMLQMGIVGNQGLADATMHQIAEQVEQHAVSRAAHAYQCEGLAPGASQLVAEINYQSRLLQQMAIVKTIGLADVDGEPDVAKRIIDRINDLQRLVGDVLSRMG